MIDFINSILKDRRATFVIGMVMLIGGLWLFVQNVYVSSPWHPAGINIGPFTFRSGVLVLPLLAALVWMFFKPKSKAAKVFACIGLALIVVYVVMSVNIKLSRVPILEWIGILLLIVIGGLFTWAGVSGKQLRIKK
ncbi:MAG: hypothetical protein IJI56_02360 [Firmicutes bacterium]|nr:hypothetical protein [Bacillota bacterium]